jgi:hypothetical protein
MVQERVRSLLTVLLVIVGVSVVIGGILTSALFLGASGFDGADPPAASPPPDSTDPLATDAPPTPPSTDDTTTEPEPTEADATEADGTEPTEDANASGFSLEANPTSVSAMEDVTLQGTFDGPDGTVLQVQRRLEGGDWDDFPVEATVNDGTYTTTIRSGRVGTNEFRMRDDTGAVSNVVTVTVQ